MFSLFLFDYRTVSFFWVSAINIKSYISYIKIVYEIHVGSQGCDPLTIHNNLFPWILSYQQIFYMSSQGCNTWKISVVYPRQGFVLWVRVWEWSPPRDGGGAPLGAEGLPLRQRRWGHAHPLLRPDQRGLASVSPSFLLILEQIMRHRPVLW